MSVAVGLCYTCKSKLNKKNCGDWRFLKFGKSSYCRSCAKTRIDKYNIVNRHAIRMQRLFKNYGISQEEFETKLKLQDSKCAICNNVVSLNSSGKSTRPHVDHDHATGINRDILCGLCNSILGLAKDDIEILKSAIRYLQKHATIV